MSAVAVKVKATLSLEYVVKADGLDPQEVARAEQQDISVDPVMFVSSYDPRQFTVEVAVVEVTDRYGRPQ